MSENLGHKAASGAIWASIERFGSLILQFIVNLILARILVPSDFGAIGMLTIFIMVAQTLIDSGFGSALIQKKDPTQIDYSTIFFWNISFSIILYLILFLFSSFIAQFFSLPILSKLLKLWGITLIISAFYSIQNIHLRKNLKFKQLAFSTILSYSLAASISIFLAYKGFGVWSLVFMYLINSVFTFITLWIFSKWHPNLVFSFDSLKKLFSFGGYIMSAAILQQIAQNLQGIIIGKRFNAAEMGYFSQADKLNTIASSSIPNVIVQVIYPVFSKIQDEKEKLKEVILFNIRVISFIIFPILSVLILSADNLIKSLYGEIWLPSVPIFQILCVGGFFICLQNITFYAVAAVGKSKELFNWSFYKWGFLLSTLLIGMLFGLYGIIWGMVLSNLNILIINSYLVSKYIHLSIIQQLKDLIPNLVCSLVTLIGCFLLKEIINPMINLIIFLLTYFILQKISRLRSLTDFIYLLKLIVNK